MSTIKMCTSRQHSTRRRCGTLSMNEDIKQYPIYYVNKDGSFTKIEHIKSTADYNHYTHNLHHYIARKHYEKNKSWYEERGIKQKLFLVPISMHEQIHNQAVHTLSDDDFEGWYKISRWDLVFNKRYSKY